MADRKNYEVEVILHVEDVDSADAAVAEAWSYFDRAGFQQGEAVKGVEILEGAATLNEDDA